MEQIRDMDQLAVAANSHIREKEYWLNQFAGPINKCSFPYDHIKPDTVNVSRFTEELFGIDSNLYDRLMKLSRGSDYALHILLTAALAIILARYAGENEITIGSPIYRPAKEGYLLNTVLPLKIHLHENNTFKDLLMAVREVVGKAAENQNYPIEILLEQLGLPFTGSDFPLFDVAIVMENIHDPVHIRHLPINTIFTFKRTMDEITGVLAYNSDLYEIKKAKSISYHFLNYLQAVLADPDRQIFEIDLLASHEIEHILYHLNKTGAAYPQHKTIHGIFEEQVEKAPHHTAIVFAKGAITFTYDLINQKANLLSTMLRKEGGFPDHIVGMVMEPSLEMIAGIIAILKAGGAYLPIDPEYPVGRIKYLLRDSNAFLALTGKDWKNKIESGTKIIEIDAQTIAGDSPGKVWPGNHPANLAYIIYTSGTTGQPKGVAIEHENVVRLLFNDNFLFDFNATDVWTMFHSYNFDFSVWEMYGALLFGGKLVLIQRMTARDPKQFLKVLYQESVTILNQVPTAFSNLIAEALNALGENKSTRLHLKYIIFGGEALKPLTLKNWQDQYEETRLINMFGITETTVHVTYKEIKSKEIEANISSLGTPIPTTTAYVMDRSLKLLPADIPGELYVGGEGVGRGYLNLPELTAEKFIFNPYKPTERLYRSGDMVKMASDGQMEYIGRIDHQVQLRGFRIELGEIETILLQKKGIREAVVLDKEGENGDKYLCAYIVSEIPFESADLRKYLDEKLPGHMIPNYFVPIEQIPLTTNGKVDRKSLPEPEIKSIREFILPASETEKTLIEIWKKVLSLDKVGITDNFFQVGGDSIKAIRLISFINNEYSSKLGISDIYTHQTVRELAFKVAEANEDIAKTVAVKEALLEIEEFKAKVLKSMRIDAFEDIEDIYPMSDIEKGMVFYSSKGAAEAFYHDQTIQPIYLNDFDLGRMKKTMVMLVKRHGTLRTALLMEESAHILYKYNNSFVEDNFTYYDISHMPVEEQRNHIEEYAIKGRSNPFNLSRPPLWRMAFFKLSPVKYMFFHEVHHAVTEGWSFAYFVTELFNTYWRLSEEPNFTLGDLKCSYKDFIIEHLAEKKNNAAWEFWKNDLIDYKRWSLPKPAAKREIKIKVFDLGVDFRQKLEEIAAKNYVSIKHMCLTAYLYTLYMLSYESDITAGVVSHTRPQMEDGEKLMGCFLNTIPFRFKFSNHSRWIDLIKSIDAKMRLIKKYDRISFLEILNIIGEKSGDINPMFDTLYNFLDFHVLNDLKFDLRRGNNENLPGLGNYTRTNFLLEFQLDVFNEFSLDCKYASDFIEDYMVENICRYFKEILTQFTTNIEGIAAKNEILSQEEKKQLLYDFNLTTSDFPRNKTVPELFAEQAAKTPDLIALVGEGKGEEKERRREEEKNGGVETLRATSLPIPIIHLQITYSQLNEQSNHLAGLLIGKGVLPENIVGIMIERSIEMIIGIFGILKSGGTYLPIDPEYPQERVDYMLKDSSTKVLVTTKDKEGEKVRRWEGEKVLLEEISQFPKSFSYSLNFLPSYFLNSSNLAYLIYTSGSTGRPKGVMIEHRSVVNRLNWMQKTYPIGIGDVILQKTTFTFDVSVWELFWWSFHGACLSLLAPGEEKDPRAIVRALANYRVTTLHFVPSMLNAFLDYLEDAKGSEALSNGLHYLRQVFASGEALIPAQVEHFYCHITSMGRKRVSLINLYGPTEATVDVSYFNCSPTENYERIPIGKPIDNINLYILDRNFQLQPPGIMGELYIAGVGLARGYLNQPELTSEKFTDFQHSVFVMPRIQHSKLYCTGDLARWLPDGNIEFLGRIDNQVKIRGFRIELGEIEYQLSKHPDIKEITVIVKSSTEEKKLYAYMVSKQEISATDLKTYLAGKLPVHMIPSYFVRLDKMPLTPNGKIDQKRLDFLGIKLGTGEDYIAPQNLAEQTIANIWKEVLHIEKIGINDNFFDLGGTSLDMIKLNSKLNETFHLDGSIMVLFRYTTIHSFANYLNSLKQETNIADAAKKPAVSSMLTFDKVKEGRMTQRNKRREKINVRN